LFRLFLVGVAAAAVIVTVGLGVARASDAGPTTQSARVVVPKVVGLRMDRATRTLRTRGLRVNEECSGLFGCIVKSRWWVCAQSPRAGRRVARYSVVVIYAERRGEC
jgi:beta-lactam-binding protein with PASTA domain